MAALSLASQGRTSSGNRLRHTRLSVTFGSPNRLRSEHGKFEGAMLAYANHGASGRLHDWRAARKTARPDEPDASVAAAAQRGPNAQRDAVKQSKDPSNESQS